MKHKGTINRAITMMKCGNIKFIILFCLLLAAPHAVFAAVEAEKLDGDMVGIGEILQSPASFEGKDVVVEGKITTECPSGCWFILDDGTGSIYVDILPSNFVIPQKRGEDALVHGEVMIKEGDPMIVGKKVEIGGETFQ
jgi:uncharacterized protein YdeI (BOF family)